MNNWQRLKDDKHLQKNFLIREKVIWALREFFRKNNYREIDVPLLAPSLPAEAHLEVFETQLLDRHRQIQRAFLTTSPEVFLKKLLVGGVGNCFSITKSFRNCEDLSNLHNPEFTLLEWYRVGANYKDLMLETERLLLFVFNELKKTRLPPQFLKEEQAESGRIIYQGQAIDLRSPWERLDVVGAFKKYAQMDLEKALELSAMKKIAQAKGYQVENATWEQLFHQVYLNEVEPHLGKTKPTIIYDFPSQMAMLAKKKKSDPRFSERFELYIAGLELGDCYSELTDWREQEARFIKEIEKIRKQGKTEYPYDKDFIQALQVGMPECAGLALGVDRLAMLFADSKNISQVLYFPASEMWPQS